MQPTFNGLLLANRAGFTFGKITKSLFGDPEPAFFMPINLILN
jgi:hypothetical protein